MAGRGGGTSPTVEFSCEHLFVSLSTLHHALRDKDAERSLQIADELRHVPLRYACRLTLLLAEKRHPRYEAAARRLLVAVADDLEPPMIELKKLADVLAHVHHHYYGWPAQLALGDVVGQLHRINEKITIDFDSEGSGGLSRRARRP